jgi:hypothetical protein
MVHCTSRSLYRPDGSSVTTLLSRWLLGFGLKARYYRDEVL